MGGVQFRELVDGAEFLLDVADAFWLLGVILISWGQGAYNKAGLPGGQYPVVSMYETVNWDEETYGSGRLVRRLPL